VGDVVLTQLLKRKVLLQTATITTGAVGQTVTWDTGTYYYARYIPADSKVILAYQSQDTVITGWFVFRGEVAVRIGRNKITDGTRVFLPAASSLYLEGMTKVMVSEVL